MSRGNSGFELYLSSTSSRDSSKLALIALDCSTVAPAVKARPASTRGWLAWPAMPSAPLREAVILWSAYSGASAAALCCAVSASSCIVLCSGVSSDVYKLLRV
eukprot:2906-Heterococcus_DN1.PRE.1